MHRPTDNDLALAPPAHTPWRPGWEHEVAASLDDGPGYAVLDDVPLGTCLEDAKRSALEVSLRLGQPMWQDTMGTVVWTVRNVEGRFWNSDNTIMHPHSTKSSRSSDPLPAHCDGAVQWLGQQIDAVVLLAYRSASGGENRVVDARRVFEAMKNEHPRSTLRLMQPAPFGRGTGILPDQQLITEQPVFAWEGTDFRARINTRRIRTTLREINRVDLELVTALDELDEMLERPEFATQVHLEPGQCLITNDRRVAHTREPYDQSVDRVMLRVWLHRKPHQRVMSWPVDLR
jgi:hypothetical protein